MRKHKLHHLIVLIMEKRAVLSLRRRLIKCVRYLVNWFTRFKDMANTLLGHLV